MRHYSIRVASQLTDIEIVTLRMWERRYGFPRPERTGGGSRLYSEAEIESLKLVKQAILHGYRPSEVVGKPRAELMRLIQVTSDAPARAVAATPTTATLLAALRRDDRTTLRAELRQAAIVLGPKRFVVDVAHPLCIRVGELWAKGEVEVRHEHMLSECLSAQLQILASAYEDRPGAPRVLLATLPNERHGLGLEMIDLYLSVRQITPILLGVDTPAEQIVKAARSHDVDVVGVLVTYASDLEATAQHLRWMLSELPRKVAIWVGGAAGPDVPLKDDAVRTITDWCELDEAIAALARRSV